MPGLLWPSRRYISRVNPQGTIAASVGSYCLNEVTGRQFAKRGGGHTEFGWYPDPTPADPAWLQWSTRSGAPLTFTGFDVGNGALGSSSAGGTVPEWNHTIGARPILPSVGIPYFCAITALNLGSYNWWRLAASSATQMPVAYSTAQTNAPAYLTDIDVSVRLVAFPPISAAAAPPADWNDTDVRIWGLCAQMNLNLSGNNEVNSDILDTARPNGVGDGLAIRYSTAAADPGWVGVVCADGGPQIVTGALAPPPVISGNGTPVVLRIRKVMTNGVLPGTAFFSVNDGPELSLPLSDIPISAGHSWMIGGSIMALANGRKTLGVVNGFMSWGVQ